MFNTLKVTEQISFNYQDVDDNKMNEKHGKKERQIEWNPFSNTLYETWHISSQIIYQTNSQWFQTTWTHNFNIEYKKYTHETKRERERESHQVSNIQGNGITA